MAKQSKRTSKSRKSRKREEPHRSLSPAAARRREAAHGRERTERHAAQHEEAFADACDVWMRLKVDQQFAVLREIVAARSEELTHAYDGVISVSYGFATRQVTPPSIGPTGRAQARRRERAVRIRELTTEPCVKFMVRQKWPTQAAKAAALKSGARPVPKLLLAHCTYRGKRKMCAVPTDLESAIVIRAQGQVAVTDDGGKGDLSLGALTCVVRLPDDDEQRYLLSCRHVFGMTEFRDGVPSTADVFNTIFAFDPVRGKKQWRVTTGPLARVTGFYGLLNPDRQDNFDAALALVKQTGNDLRQAVPPLARAQFIRTFNDFPRQGEYIIETPSGDKRAKWAADWSSGTEIMYQINGQGERAVRIPVPLVQSELLDDETAPGDSGSPAVTTDRRTLLGMHIAGAGSAAYMIPAYVLMRTGNYVGLAPGEWLRMTLNY